MIRTSLYTTVAAVALFAAVGAAAADPPRTVAGYPPGTFLENLRAGPDGALVITSYFDRTLLTWPGGGAPTVLARLDAYPAGVLVRKLTSS